MDEEEPGISAYAKVALQDHTDDTDGVALVRGEEEMETLEEDGAIEILSTPPSILQRAIGVLNKNLLPDQAVVIRDFPLVEGEFTVKFLKFLLLTFGSIALVHKIVEHYFTDRDRSMTLSNMWRFDTNLIVMDSLIFFVVGRMWKQKGVDHLAWIIPVVICNLYFESQNFVQWLQHSVSLYQIHCVWPWQLWIFVLVLIPTIGVLVLAHAVRAWNKRVLLVKLVELSMCVFFFLAPVMTSSYFHFHHWFAGWLLGMHCNYDVWWSRAAMAYCWGMYINGIAVYGRDPVLTCEYAYFLSLDNKCPYVKCYLDALEDMAAHPHNATHVVQTMEPVDWRNCSATGYHP